MKTTLLLFTATLTAAAVLHAQAPAAAPAPAPAVKPTLTPEQVNNVLKQLADLEKNILQQRNASLSGIIQKLRSAAGSNAAAINFIEECDALVNVERKDGDKKDELRIKQKAEQAKRGETKQEEDKEGDHATGLRLCLEYIALSLEAHEAKDLSTMAPKIAAFHQTLMDQGKKLKGRTGDMLMQPIGRQGGGGGGGGRRGGGGGAQPEVGVVIEAYQLSPYLRTEGWPLEPGNIIGMYDKVLLKSVREKKPGELAASWDSAINTEAGFRKERMAEGDFTVWQQQEYPNLRWMRAHDLLANSGNQVMGLAEMLKVIKDFPNHPGSPGWVTELRSLVAPVKTDAPPVTAVQ